MNLKNLCSSVITIVKKTGDFIHKESLHFNRSEVEYKSYNALVSYVDKTAEIQLVESLKKLIPDAGFITEENTIKEQKKTYIWIIDPLDGTTNFVHNIPVYGISVALMYKNEIILGVVYEVNRKETFYAWKGSKSYLNGKVISVSKVDNLERSLIATGFPYRDFGLMKSYMEAFTFFMKNTQGVRRLGSASIDLAYTACGIFEAFFEYGLASWDVAAGILIAQNAGAKISDFSGGNNYLFGGEIIVSCPEIHHRFQKVIKNSFKKRKIISTE